MNNATQASAFAPRGNRPLCSLLYAAMLTCAALSFAQSAAPAGSNQQRGPATLQPAAGTTLKPNGVNGNANGADALRIAPGSKGAAPAAQPAGAQSTPATPPVEEVVRFLTGAEPLQPARNITRTNFWQANAYWLAPSLGGLLIAIALIARGLLRHSRRPVAQSPQLLALQAISAAELHSDDKYFAVDVSNAVRGYLEARFHLRAPEQTTEEFLHEARNSATLPQEAVQALAHLLELCDLAKFARQGLSTAQRQELGETARQLVQVLGTPPATPAQPAATPAT